MFNFKHNFCGSNCFDILSSTKEIFLWNNILPFISAKSSMDDELSVLQKNRYLKLDFSIFYKSVVNCHYRYKIKINFNKSIKQYTSNTN